jgi:mono/diheme cytochrome c family protein
MLDEPPDNHLAMPPDADNASCEHAAVMREMRIPENGKQSISLWIICMCAAVLLLAGVILGDGGWPFSYAALFREGYKRSAPPGSIAKPLPPKPALDAYMALGKKVFEAKCIVCHGPAAKGDGLGFPSLVGSAWANGATERFAMIILNGLQGPVSNGRIYGLMPPQGIGMTPEELAGIMTYVRNHFGNTTGDIITVEMATAAMQISSTRKNAGQAVTTLELTADHLKPLPGTPVVPTTMVNPLTMEPVTTAAPVAATPVPADGGLQQPIIKGNKE